jgi:FAD/FMN-containing dehydrogenase
MYEELKKLNIGDVKADQKTRDFYSHDTSLFEINPDVVVFPKSVDDIRKLVRFVTHQKPMHPDISLTARSGGSCMSGGSINDSIIVVFEKYLNKLGEVRNNRIKTQPGVWYKDFEKITLKHGKIFPSYPASRNLAAMGGIVANNAGGEKSLEYGKTEDYVKNVKVVLADGNEYEFGPITKSTLDKKVKQKDFEGRLYREIFKLLDKNFELIKQSKPNVTKNSTAYNIWDVWDKNAKIFDMSQLFVGSQGTLGLITETEIGLVDDKPYSGMLVGYVHSLDNLGELIREVVKHRPTSFETFDDHTVKFAIRFFLQFRKTLGWWGLIKLAIGLIPDAILLLRSLPKLILLVEYEGDTEEEVVNKIQKLRTDLEKQEFKILLENAETKAKSQRFWLMRRESFNLLRKNVKGNVHTAPYIDDLIVPPVNLPKFLPKFTAILDRYELVYTIAGHMGDGNFHVIPLMDFSDQSEVEKIEPSLREVNALVLEYGGSISGEHNDGLIRGPFLEDMYGPKMMEIFKEIKSIFDPDNIFNPHKKTKATWKYSRSHMRDHF